MAYQQDCLIKFGIKFKIILSLTTVNNDEKKI